MMIQTDHALTGFLRVPKKYSSRLPVASQLVSEIITQSEKGTSTDSIYGQELTQVPIHVTPERTQKFWSKEGPVMHTKLPEFFQAKVNSDRKRSKDLLQYDFLLEGLLAEWRARRQHMFKPVPEVKPSTRSFFPHQHNQIKYWAWPFLGMVALTSSLPLVHGTKKPLLSTLQPYHVEVQVEVDPEYYEVVAALPSSDMPLFETLSYHPSEDTTQPNAHFEQTLSLDLASNEVDLASQNSESSVHHPVATFDYSKMVLELFVKKAYCESCKPKGGYVQDVVFTTSESESYYPVDPVQEPVKTVPDYLKMVDLEEVVFSPMCILPIRYSPIFCRLPMYNPLFYREAEKQMVYDYAHEVLSTEADYRRRKRRSVQFASRPIDHSLRLRVSLNELSVFKNFVTPNKPHEVKGKWKPKVKAKPWKASMDATQWVKTLVLNSKNAHESLLSSTQQSANENPRTIRLFAQDWPTLPTQFKRISKGSPKRPEIDTVSFLTSLADPQQPINAAVEFIQSPTISMVIQESVPEVALLNHLSRRLSNWLTDWFTTWSLMYSTSEGVLNDATFTNQFTKQLGHSQLSTDKWTRPQVLQNPNYQALAETDSLIRSDLPEQLFRASLTYKNGQSLPASMPSLSAEYTRVLERNQGPLRFNLMTASGTKGRKVKTLAHPTVGSLFKTFVFRSPSYLDYPNFDQKRLELKRRRASRYARVGIAVKKRKRISPRPRWLRSVLYHPFLKLRHPEMAPRTTSGVSQIKYQQVAQVSSNLNLKNKLTHNFLTIEGPSLFRQKALHHRLMTNLPQLTKSKFYKVAKWAEPQSKLKGWRIFVLGSEFAPYTNLLNSNFKQLQKVSEDNRRIKFDQMPQWFWKESHSASQIEGLRFKQNLVAPLFTESFTSGSDLNSEATMSHLLLNELRLVARQNQAIYHRLNTAILLHRNKHRFMAATRPELSNVNRVRLLKRKHWAWPDGWANVALSPWNQIESKWFVKQSHLLRNSSVNDIQELWNIGKLRTRNKAARESHQRGIFRLRLPFRLRTKVHPITVGRAWKKVDVMDRKLNAFGVINSRAQLYPRQLKLRFQKERGATQVQNSQLTTPDIEIQKYMNRSVQFWWNETENHLFPLVNPVGTQPWNAFEGLMAIPQLTSEAESLGVTLVNGSMILLHVALLSFLIQLPETRTFLKFYLLVFSRIASGYLWMATMCYSLLRECIYEIQYALFCGRVLVFPPKDRRRFTYKMLAKQLHRAERNPHINGRLVYCNAQSIKASNVKALSEKTKVALELMAVCMKRYHQLMREETFQAQRKITYTQVKTMTDEMLKEVKAARRAAREARRAERDRQEALEYEVQLQEYLERQRLAEQARLENPEAETSPEERIVTGPEDIFIPVAMRAVDEETSSEEEDIVVVKEKERDPEELARIYTETALAAVDSPSEDNFSDEEGASGNQNDTGNGNGGYSAPENQSGNGSEGHNNPGSQNGDGNNPGSQDGDGNNPGSQDGDGNSPWSQDGNNPWSQDPDSQDGTGRRKRPKNQDGNGGPSTPDNQDGNGGPSVAEKQDDFEDQDLFTDDTYFKEESSSEEEDGRKADYYLQYAKELYDSYIARDPLIDTLSAEVKREPWWSYKVVPDSTTYLGPSTDDLSIRLMEAEQNWTGWDYELFYMKERQKAYKKALPADYVSVQKVYQRALNQSVFIKDSLRHKMYKGLVTFTKSVVGLYFLIYRKYYRFYYAVDTVIATGRRLTLQFLEEPADNATKALNNYFFIAFTADLLTARDDASEALQTLFVQLYTRQMNAFGPLGVLAQRRLHRLADEAYIAWTKPDMDLLMRHQKSLIFWNMWGALLIQAVSRYNLSMTDLLSTKEEREKLVECLITESDWSWTQQSLIQFQPLFDLFSLGKRTWNDFTVSTVQKQLGEPLMLEEVLHPQNGSTQAGHRRVTDLDTFEKINPADVLYADNHAVSLDALSLRWGAQQMSIYHSRMTALPIEYHPAGNLRAVPQIKFYNRMHTQLGWIIQDNLRTTFVNTPSKNALIIGPSGPEVTSLIRAVVGELEMKLITDNARRYTTVIRNVAIGVRHLKEIFYSVAVEAPCLFVLEDIHLIGRRRELLIAEDEELYLLERMQGTPINEDYEENYSIDKFEKHTLLHYEKPFRGDYSFLISTNCFAFDYFVEPAPSRLRQLGLFTKSHYKLRAIEQELVKLRGLENLSNAQAKAPALSLTSTIQARQPVKEVKPAPNSPLTVAIEKNKKAFRPRRIVKNMPLQGISWDMWMLLSRYDYSIRSKVALLAVLTEDAVGELTDMITDLLVMMDTVRATRGVIMFATTHAPTSLDPALRRPGRLDETLTVPLFSSIGTRWEVLDLRLKGIDPLQELAPYALVTRNLSNYKVSQLALQTTLAFLPKKVSLGSTSNPSSTPTQALKAQMHMSYLEAFVNSKGFDQLKEQMADMIDVPSEATTLDTQMRQRKFQIKVNTLAYTLVGAHLIHWKAKVITDQLEAQPLSYSVEKVHPLLNHLEQQNEYLQLRVARTRDPLMVREHVTNSLAPRFAETFFTSSLLNPSSVLGPDKDMASLQLTFQLRDKTNYVPLTFQKFELAATRFKPGGSSVFTPFFPAFRNNLINLGVPASRTSDFISSVIQKRAMWTQNLVVYRLLYLPMNQDYREPHGLPTYDLTDPDKHFETLQKELRVLYRPGNLTMNEKIELHKNYRLYLALANRTMEDWHATYKPDELRLLKRHVLPSLEELSSLALVMNHPTGTHSYYRQSMHLRQRFHLIDQWWNGHLEDYDVETTLLSDVETRTFFEESIGNDVEIDYPQPEKYYNVRSRRWIWKRTAESWFLKGAKFTDAAAYHYMVCALTRCYEELHKNRESLDHLAYTFLKAGTVSELETFSHYTRFYQTDV
jgi:SpoVK/Ycf46/Vps4 family AAA+-type ATPase